MNTASSTFAELAPALRVARLYKGLRQTVVAERAGVTKAMLSAFEHGQRRPSLATLEKLLPALEIDLDVLFRLMVVFREYRSGRFSSSSEAAGAAVGPHPTGQREETGSASSSLRRSSQSSTGSSGSRRAS